MKRTLTVGLVCLSMASFQACTKRVEDERLMVFHGFETDDAKTFDPANAYDANTLDVVSNIYETLYEYDYLAETYKLIPLLAADFPKYSDDRLTVTIRLRVDVKFQDDPVFKATNGKGRLITAQDFIYGIKRLALPSIQSSGWWTLDGKVVGINAFHDTLVKAPKDQIKKLFESEIEGLKALDEHTIQIKLIKPYPQLMYVLAMNFTSPIAQEAVEAYADPAGNLTDHPVGTGPFVLKTWERNHRIVLERNPSFHPDFYPTEAAPKYKDHGFLADAGKALPFLDQIEWQIVRESSPAWLGFMQGNFDVATIPKDSFNDAIQNRFNLKPELSTQGIQLDIETGAVFYNLTFNMKDKLLGPNKFLRQALSAAIDREKWIELFTNGRGVKQSTILPPGIPDRPSTSRLKYDYDIKFAKELLKKSGYPEGKGLPVLNFDTRGADSESRQQGDFFTQQFDAIGVKINVNLNTLPAYTEKVKQGSLQIFYGGWQMDYPDAENALQILYGPNQSPGPNEANFDNKEFNKLYDKVAVQWPGASRAETIAKMDKIVQEECPWAFGFYRATYRLHRPWLKNHRPSDIINNRHKFFRVDPAGRKQFLSSKH